jgi:hypothetical protein
MHYNHCHRATAHLGQLNILLLLLLLLYNLVRKVHMCHQALYISSKNVDIAQITKALPHDECFRKTNNAAWPLDGDPSSVHAAPIAAAYCCGDKMAGNLLTATPTDINTFVHSGRFIFAKDRLVPKQSTFRTRVRVKK